LIGEVVENVLTTRAGQTHGSALGRVSHRELTLDVGESKKDDRISAGGTRKNSREQDLSKNGPAPHGLLPSGGHCGGGRLASAW
jgi:hypothetical protein